MKGTVSKLCEVESSFVNKNCLNKKGQKPKETACVTEVKLVTKKSNSEDNIATDYKGSNDAVEPGRDAAVRGE